MAEIKTGYIESREYKRSELSEGIKAILHQWEKKTLTVGVVNHITKAGNWFFIPVDSRGSEGIIIGDMDKLYYLVFVPFPIDGPEIAVKPAQWASIIRASDMDKDKIIEANINEIHFFTGDFPNSCKSCGNDFEGGRTQNLCKVCCSKNSIATILRKKKSELVVSTRDDIYTQLQMIKLVDEFLMDIGLESGQFGVWIKKRELAVVEASEKDS